ncbi:two-component system response regulator OmpR [Thiocapsa imhoffii]|uniref:Two-component system response regulator OmpR n=1 Tax=Thiocapsa imhoffii TaxID=382777 RepID=A0A9X1B7G5_9GAMM|nr:response regulator [Thiocapsa imhoffii]MBK1643652.1 two-component system response regulator OmpR [Thiocapsa imhoffii]
MSERPIRILVVDDDAALRALLGDYLAGEGYRVAGAEDGLAMDDWLSEHETDLVILDLMLPGDDGLTLARRLRARTDVPIIILSARGDDIDRIVGLEVGADDYLPKPFNPRELLARIRAVLRRRFPSDAASGGEVLRFGPYRLDLAQRELRRGDEVIVLTSGELELLRILTEHPDRVLDRDRLLDLLKGYERSPFDRSIDVQIARLRAKIELDTKRPRYIRTIWGKGYMFTPTGEA